MEKKRKRRIVPRNDLAEARVRRRHTQAQAAEYVGISQGSWSAIESGAKKPSRPLAKLLALYAAGKDLD